MEQVSRKQQIRKTLEEKGKAMTITELSKALRLPEIKVRQTLTSFEYDIVRIGPKVFDLTERIYKGKTFRYTPDKTEIEKGVLKAEEDVHLFLTACISFWSDINLVDKEGNSHILKRLKIPRGLPFDYYRGIEKWYKKSNFELGDDMLFKCIDLKTHKFLINRQKRKERDELKITVKNRQLGDFIYDIIIHSMIKYEMDLFLVRKYLFVFPFNDPVPPDSLVKALSKDYRFLISKDKKMLSWSGHLLDEELSIGIRKYYFKNEDGEYVPVIIDQDEFGKYGYCSLCSERVIWEKETGWRHTLSDAEWADSYIPPEFFKIDSKENTIN